MSGIICAKLVIVGWTTSYQDNAITRRKEGFVYISGPIGSIWSTSLWPERFLGPCQWRHIRCAPLPSSKNSFISFFCIVGVVTLWVDMGPTQISMDLWDEISPMSGCSHLWKRRRSFVISPRKWPTRLRLSGGWLPHVLGVTDQNDSFMLLGIEH